jgi:hypothetical protein
MKVHIRVDREFAMRSVTQEAGDLVCELPFKIVISTLRLKSVKEMPFKMPKPSAKERPPHLADCLKSF